MSDKVSYRTTAFSGFGIGVWWFVWGAKSFWWGVVYGAFWPVWLGYRAAAWLWVQP